MISRERGLSIVELMVAMVISLILTAGVIQVFLGSKTTYRVTEGVGRLQEDGRFALEYLSRDIRMAGYSGCSRYGPVTNTVRGSTGNLAYDFAVGITGYNDIGTTPPAALSALNLTPPVKQGTDVIVVRRESDNPVRIIQNNNGAQLFADSISEEAGACTGGGTRYSGLCEGDILMVSDCRKARVFQAGNMTKTGSGANATVNVTHPSAGSPGNDPSSWGGASAPEDEIFGDDAEIVKLASYIYYVGTDNVLYRKDGLMTAVDISQGVDDLQVVYGIDTTPTDTDQSANIYTATPTAAQFENAVSVRVHLLIASIEDNLAAEPQAYRYMGANQPAENDRRIRKEFTSLVTLRNRVR